MGRRGIAIVLLVGGFLLLAVVALVFFLQQGDEPGADAPVAEEGGTAAPDATPGEGEPQPTTPAGTPSPLVEVVVSLQTVSRGYPMTEAELTTDLRRVEEVDNNVFTNIEDVVGLYARTDIFQGETLTRDAFVSDPTLAGIEDYGPSSLIPEGFQAQAVPMDRLSSVAYGLAEGDSIDILLTFYVAEVDPEFQTLLQNSAALFLETANEESGEVNRSVFIIDPLGRFEEQPNGDLALIGPSEEQRPLRVSFLLQNARVIQVGAWTPEEAVRVPTATPTPNPEATATPAGAGTVPTATPPPPDVLLLALAPQQQLILKYAVESAADIAFALRGPNDNQIYGVENVDLTYLLDRFGIETPIDYEYTTNPVFVTVTPPVSPTPVPAEGGGGGG